MTDVLKEPGVWPCLVIGIGKDPSKKGFPMLTVTWKSFDPTNQGEIRDYLAMKYIDKSGVVVDNKFALQKLAKLKVILGLPQDAKGEALIGQRAMLTVKLGKANAEGKQFSEIENYSPYRAGDVPAPESHHAEDTIPF